MRRTLLVSGLLLYPLSGFAQPSCAIPSAPPATSIQSPAAPVSDTAPHVAAPVIGADRIARIPALRRISSNGAALYDLGVQHGLPTIFAKSGSTFQVFYLTPDGQAAIGGVMWDYTGHNITRDQVTPIDGTIPTVVDRCDGQSSEIRIALLWRNRPSLRAPWRRSGTRSSASQGRQQLRACTCSSTRYAASPSVPWISYGHISPPVSCRSQCVPLSVLDY